MTSALGRGGGYPRQMCLKAHREWGRRTKYHLFCRHPMCMPPLADMGRWKRGRANFYNELNLSLSLSLSLSHLSKFSHSPAQLSLTMTAIRRSRARVVMEHFFFHMNHVDFSTIQGTTTETFPGSVNSTSCLQRL